jgi:hypothetical protein
VFGWVAYDRPVGSTRESFRDRGFFVEAIEFSNGARLSSNWNWNAGPGSVSLDPLPPDAPSDGSEGFAWGLNPRGLRPDGESKARDFLAAQLMKATTAINGVWVSWANRSRCEPDAWVGPDEAGAHFCTRPGAFEDGWAPDVEVSALPAGNALPVAKMTLASSGLPDALVPGGFVLHEAGSAALADPDWDGCAWPRTFVPDLSVYEDFPGDVGGPAGLTGNAYRFGKDDQDIRVVLSTNRRREYCPEGP